MSRRPSAVSVRKPCSTRPSTRAASSGRSCSSASWPVDLVERLAEHAPDTPVDPLVDLVREEAVEVRCSAQLGRRHRGHRAEREHRGQPCAASTSSWASAPTPLRLEGLLVGHRERQPVGARRPPRRGCAGTTPSSAASASSGARSTAPRAAATRRSARPRSCRRSRGTRRTRATPRAATLRDRPRASPPGRARPPRDGASPADAPSRRRPRRDDRRHRLPDAGGESRDVRGGRGAAVPGRLLVLQPLPRERRLAVSRRADQELEPALTRVEQRGRRGRSMIRRRLVLGVDAVTSAMGRSERREEWRARDPADRGRAPSVPRPARVEALRERVLAGQARVGNRELSPAPHAELLPQHTSQCALTVRGEMPSRSETSSFEQPAAIRTITSRWRSVMSTRRTRVPFTLRAGYEARLAPAIPLGCNLGVSSCGCSTPSTVSSRRHRLRGRAGSSSAGCSAGRDREAAALPPAGRRVVPGRRAAIAWGSRPSTSRRARHIRVPRGAVRGAARASARRARRDRRRRRDHRCPSPLCR